MNERSKGIREAIALPNLSPVQKKALKTALERGNNRRSLLLNLAKNLGGTESDYYKQADQYLREIAPTVGVRKEVQPVMPNRPGQSRKTPVAQPLEPPAEIKSPTKGDLS